MKLSQARLLVDDFPAAFRSHRDEPGLEPGASVTPGETELWGSIPMENA